MSCKISQKTQKQRKNWAKKKGLEGLARVLMG